MNESIATVTDMNDLNAKSSEDRWPKLAASTTPVIDLPRIARAVREILISIGEDPDREGLTDTPGRVARAYRDLTAGMGEDPGDHLGTIFHEGGDDLVVVRGIELHSLCEHHMLPFSGVAHVAYLPSGGRVVGLSKIARAVETFARRLQVQERLTRQVADAMVTHLEPRGVAVVIESEHMCMKMRGVAKQGATMTTVAHRGVFVNDAAARTDVMALLRAPGGR